MARRHFIISWHSYDNRAHILGARKHAPERHVAKYDYSSGLLISELDKLICFYLASDMFFPGADTSARRTSGTANDRRRRLMTTFQPAKSSCCLVVQYSFTIRPILKGWIDFHNGNSEYDMNSSSTPLNFESLDLCFLTYLLLKSRVR